MNQNLLIIFYGIGLIFAQSYKDDLVSAADLLSLNLPITETVYSGYLPVNDAKTAQFHYYYVHADDSFPVTLWLNGGPGCSSAQGMWNENGPTNFVFGTAIPESNPYSWTTVSNMLYLESPIGVGFSYGPNQPQNDTSTAQYNLQALISFFQKFPQLQGSEFYITGESYAGINLVGVMIGNGCTDVSECTEPAFDWEMHLYSYLGGQGMVSPQMHQLTQQNSQCLNDFTRKCEAIANQFWTEFFYDQEKDEQRDINLYYVYGPCPQEDFEVNGQIIKRKLGKVKGRRQFFNPKLRGSIIDPCDDSIGIFTLLRNSTFTKAFHIDTKQTPAWFECSDIDYTIGDEASYYLYPKLIQNNIRIWKFSGDNDAVVPITGTLYWINKFQNQYNLRTIVDWRPWYVTGNKYNQRQVAGNFWKLNGLTFASVKGAGHMVPTDKRAEALALFSGFLLNTDLPAS